MSGFGNTISSGLTWSLGGLHYQFITTGPENETYSGSVAQVLKGSAIAVVLPKKISGTLSFEDVKPIATGSTLEALPTDPPTPPSADSALIQRINGTVQAQFYPESSYYSYTNDDYKKYIQSLHSWSSVPGIIYGAGAFMFAPAFLGGDVGYDLSFSQVSKPLKNRLPDSDWPHDSMSVFVSSIYGSRRFVVMVDASGIFHCWPHVYEDKVFDSPYSNQGQNVNVDPNYVISVAPPYPNWVYVPVDNRRDTDWPPGTYSGDPRYVWRFNSYGTKVVGIVLKRETLSSRDIYGRTIPTTTPKFQEQIIDSFEIDSSVKDTGLSYTGSPKNDWPGYVEFSINIEITGYDLEDFTFSLSLLRSQEPDEDHYIIAAHYLYPIINGWTHYGVNASVGDLIVLNLGVYRSDRNQKWIDRHCGYLGIGTDYIRQTWLDVIDVNTDTTIRSFLMRDIPDDFWIESYRLTMDDWHTIEGKLLHIDLSTLSFVYQATRSRFSIDENSYYEESSYKARQRWQESDTGIRYYVFNTKVVESRRGTNLDLWNTIDTTGLFVGNNKVDCMETNVRWFNTTNTRLYDRHWLLQALLESGELSTSIYGQNWEGITVYRSVYEEQPEYYTYYFTNPPYAIATDNEFANFLLITLSAIGSSASGDPITDYKVNYADTLVQEHPVLIVGYVTSIDQQVYDYTNIKNIFYLGCSTCTSDYFNVLLDWFKDIRDLYCQKGIYYPVLDGEGIGGVQSWSMTVETNAGYQYPSFEMPTSFVRSQQVITVSPEDACLKTFTDEHIHQHVYDYPIGSEIYMREWKNSVESDRNFGLLVSPEGFYAGQLWIPYFTDKIPAYTLFSVKSGDSDYYNESYYFSYTHDYYTLYQDVHFIGRDLLLSDSNKPSSSQFKFINTDILSHIDAVDYKTHTELYESAFLHSLSITDPEIRVRVGTDYPVDYGYYFIERGVIYNGDTLWSNFFSDDTFIFKAPRFNGSMLFSKI